MRPCTCKAFWCSLLRTKHLFGDRLVKLTTDIIERSVWLNHLEVTGDHVVDLEAVSDKRVWVGHFHQNDFVISSDADGGALLDRINFNGLTKYRDYDTGRSSLSAPPRPAATKSLTSLSVFSDRAKLAFADYILLSSGIQRTRRKRNKIEAENESPDIFTTPSQTASGGRGYAIPFFELFIGMSENIIALIRTMSSHGQSCKGSIHFRRGEITTKRLALSVRCSCSLRKKCTSWDTGSFRWQSTSDIKISPVRSVPIPDLLYALAVCMTPNTMAHADQLFSAMMMTPPSRNLLKDIIKLVVDPYLKR
jgi:hypothetical protein